MDLPSTRVHEVLVSKGVRRLYHANTVLTSSHFIRDKSLLSRGTAAIRRLKQTPQYSDRLDKRYSVWFDVFADSVDIHSRARTANRYGPVTFKFDVALIAESYTGGVWVTKLNPTKWTGKSREKRWFQSIGDLEDNFEYGTFDHMIVFRHCGGVLPFSSFLQLILLDDPDMVTEDEGADLFSLGFGALRLAMSDADLDVTIRRRPCAAGCACKHAYQLDPTGTHAKFFPAL